MMPVSQGKPCAGNPHARFEEGASAQAEPRRSALLHNRLLIMVFGCAVIHDVWAWTAAETNAVVRELVAVAALQLESEESVESDCIIDPPNPIVTAYESLFATNRQTQLPYWNQWTPAERRTAFESFLSETAQGISYEGIPADRALQFCLD